ncbi:TetR/AcrR family transcriptional regulator [Saccharopolyspora sp. K220]|uniref:TetR/AcrR family transcriptional regulator n=1 Tax=Saccharopolyspora soli TaxID=2926618 RepID=UPI001F582E7F|nr:TetR/AcrR family transcriptional regulator [Saccharopolyspora soli]MCI2422394.1 TetR/AcrR family transcriptional regulator [Saccharopolyspora soli]
MPAPFSEDERNRITELLLESGRELFAVHGLRKTSLEDLVRPTGIAKTSFYAFFDSKEALYLELLIRQAPEVTQAFRETLSAAADARSGIEAMIREGIRTATTDPLYRRLLAHPDELVAVSRKVGPEEMARSQPYVLAPMLEFIEQAQRGGALVDTDPMVVVGVIQAVAYTVVHSDEIGPQYPAILDLLIRSVAIGLTSEDIR